MNGSTPANDPILEIEKDDGIAIVTLNRPDKLNSLSRDLRRALVAAFHGLEADGDVDVAILTGRGRAFCAGLDLKELGGETSAGGADDGPAGPGSTRGGAGRSGSCTSHSHHGSFGVSLYPKYPDPSRALISSGPAAPRAAAGARSRRARAGWMSRRMGDGVGALRRRAW